MTDPVSQFIESIRAKHLRPGIRVLSNCKRCLAPLKLDSDKLDPISIQKYLYFHLSHSVNFLASSDGLGWTIEINTKPILEASPDPVPEPSPSTPIGGGGLKESQRTEPTIEGMRAEKPISQLKPEPPPGIEKKPIVEPEPTPVPGADSPGSKSTPQTEDHPGGTESVKRVDATSNHDTSEDDTIEDYTWIKLYRKLRKNPIYKDSIAVHLLIHLLLTANHKPNRFIFNEKEITVKRGQLVAGRKQISEETGVSEWAVRKRLQLFEKLGILTRKTTSKFSIISICNYKHYQESNYENSPDISPTGEGCLTTSTSPAPHQQPATNKNVKNVRSKTLYVEGDPPLRLAGLLLEEIRKNKADFKEPNLQKWAREVDFMIRRDGRSPDQIEKVILWVQGDHGDGGSWKGWAPNILSPSKLRKKFDELELKMEATVGRKPKPSW